MVRGDAISARYSLTHVLERKFRRHARRIVAAPASEPGLGVVGACSGANRTQEEPSAEVARAAYHDRPRRGGGELEAQQALQAAAWDGTRGQHGDGGAWQPTPVALGDDVRHEGV